MDMTLNRRTLQGLLVTLVIIGGYLIASAIPLPPEIALSRLRPLIPVGVDHGPVQQILFATVNWLNVRLGPILFGLLLGASLAALASSIRTAPSAGGLRNSWLGALAAVPPAPGSSSNPPAPADFALAQLVARPALNAVVIAVLIAVFPWHLVFTKLAVTLLLVLVGLPLLTVLLPRLVGSRAPARDEYATASAEHHDEPAATASPFLSHFGACLATVGIRALPLIVLAALIASALTVLLPWDAVLEWIPNSLRRHRVVNDYPNLVALALIGTYAFAGAVLRVPLVADLIIVSALIASGMPVRYAMALLFALGLFNLRVLRFTWNRHSAVAALLLFVGVIGCAGVSGVAAHFAAQGYEVRQSARLYQEYFAVAEPVRRPVHTAPAGVDDAQLLGELAERRLMPAAMDIDVTGIELASIPLASPDVSDAALFSRVDAAMLGIDEPSPFSLFRHVSPRYWGRGVATGDVHNDGWPDVIVAADNLTVGGFALYTNRHGAGFTKQTVDIPALQQLEVLNVALVDIDDDGWLDIFLSAYRGGNHIIYNDEGRFTEANVYTLPDDGAVVAAAVSFGDLDHDGDLDIFIGNWTVGYLRGVIPGEPARSQNFVLIQEDGAFTPKPVEDYPAETLVSLLSDIDADGHLDLIVGNDFAGSDVYYYGDGKGNFDEIVYGTGVIPHTTDSTMSVHTADIDNDLVPEIYLDQIARGGINYESLMKPAEELCADLTDVADRNECETERRLNTAIDESREKRDSSICFSIDDPVLHEDCMVLHVLWDAWLLEEGSLCAFIPEHRTDVAKVCADIFGPHIQVSNEYARDVIPQILSENVLLVRQPDGTYLDKAREMGVAIGGWGWNAKFADVDNDEWQDIYVANGMIPRAMQETNYFFHNMEGKTFADHTDVAGLTDFWSVGGYSYFDFDNDGDLDIVSVPVDGPVRMFVNNTAGARSIMFELRDELGNHFGIGSKIIIRYGDAMEKHQMRELQAGGGFISFDAPVAHFGLGSHTTVAEVEVQWPTGDTTTLSGPLSSGNRYILTRKRSGELTTR